MVKAVSPGFYYFEPCEPEDVAYRLDFNPQEGADKECYLQMDADYGREYIQQLNDFSYFRKRAADAKAAELAIFFHCGIGFYRLRKKYTGEKTEI